MANVDRAFGLRPVYHTAGGVIRRSEYFIADDYATAIFTGDPVLTSGSGKEINIGTAGGNIVGVFDGCQYVNDQGEVIYSRYWPAAQSILTGTTAVAYVYDDPAIMFAVQVATDGTGITAAMIGQLADLASGTGDTSTGISGWELTAPAGAEAQVRIMELNKTPGNAYGEHAVVNVLIGEHELRNGLVEV